MVPSCTNNKSSICTAWIKWCRPVQTTRAVYVLHGFNGAVLYKQQELYMYYMDSMVPSCTNNKSCICTTWIQWVPSCTNNKSSICTAWIKWCRTNGLYVLMVPSCTNNKSCICTTWIQWCRPVQTTRAVYVLHGFNGAVLYKQQELYKSSICTTWIQWCRLYCTYK